ncbi:MAG: signal recognition particle protein [Planctomycetia bacterium TMED53]|nr:MAG: signal recognition particle protein [Planctomycetia bacterium TMED53]
MLGGLTKRLTDIVSGLRGRKITEEVIKETSREIRRALLEADASLPVVKDFEKRVREAALGVEVIEGVDAGQMFTKIVQDELTDLMGPVDHEIAWKKSGATVILMSGLQGSGKTTTCGKLARYFRERKKKRPMLVAADLQRPAAIEQLKVLGRQLDVPVFHQEGLTPPQVCEAALGAAREQKCDVIILDTAGRLHVDDQLMGELKQIADKTKPDETFFVCDAMTGQDAVRSAEAFSKSLELSGVILTKLDGDARGGAALSVKAITGKPVKFVGVGEKLDRLDEFHPDRMASRILGMGDVVGLVDRAQQVIDEKEQAEMQEKLLEANFTLQDFLSQLRQIKKMGSLKDLLAHIPGLGGQVDQMDIQGDELVIVESIIQSMTAKERQRPEIINTSRRRRIAAGAGRPLEAVNDLLKQFKQMQGMMQGFKKQSGLFGKLKGMRDMKQGMDQMQDPAGGGVPGMPGLPGMPGGVPGEMPQIPGLGGGPGAPGKAKAGPSKEERRKKRKQERQRRKKSRRR